MNQFVIVISALVAIESGFEWGNAAKRVSCARAAIQWTWKRFAMSAARFWATKEAQSRARRSDASDADAVGSSVWASRVQSMVKNNQMDVGAHTEQHKAEAYIMRGMSERCFSCRHDHRQKLIANNNRSGCYRNLCGNRHRRIRAQGTLNHRAAEPN